MKNKGIDNLVKIVMFSLGLSLAQEVHATRYFAGPFEPSKEYNNENNNKEKTSILYKIKPNPFKESTIHYIISHNSSVNLSIYDTSGRLVRTLVNENSEIAGDYTVKWDGKDNNGEKVSSGVYFSRLKTEDFTSTKKIILVR